MKIARFLIHNLPAICFPIFVGALTALFSAQSLGQMKCSEVFKAKEQAYVEGFRPPIEYAQPKAMEEYCSRTEVFEPLGSFEGCKVCQRKGSDLVVVEKFIEGQLAGQLRFSVYEFNGKHLMEVIWVQVAPNFYRRGVSENLFKAALEMLNWEVDLIKGDMGFTNFETIVKAYYNITNEGNPLYQPNLGKAQATQQALEASPFFRVLDKLGYGKIHQGAIGWTNNRGYPEVAGVGLTLERAEQ